MPVRSGPGGHLKLSGYSGPGRAIKNWPVATPDIHFYNVQFSILILQLSFEILLHDWLVERDCF